MCQCCSTTVEEQTTVVVVREREREKSICYGTARLLLLSVARSVGSHIVPLSMFVCNIQPAAAAAAAEAAE